MKALSIQQPWAALIVHGHKTLENRSWRSSFRGPLLIHAGLQTDGDAIRALASNRHPVTGAPWPAPTLSLQCGGIVGVAEMVNCVSEHESEWFVGPHAFVLVRARPLPFRPWRGQLGLFDVPETLAPPAPAPGQTELW